MQYATLSNFYFSFARSKFLLFLKKKIENLRKRCFSRRNLASSLLSDRPVSMFRVRAVGLVRSETLFIGSPNFQPNILSDAPTESLRTGPSSSPTSHSRVSTPHRRRSSVTVHRQRIQNQCFVEPPSRRQNSEYFFLIHPHRRRRRPHRGFLFAVRIPRREPAVTLRPLSPQRVPVHSISRAPR